MEMVLSDEVDENFFSKERISLSDSRIEFFKKALTGETVTETNIFQSFSVGPYVVFKVRSIQFRLVGLEGAELLKYENCFALEFMICDRTYRYMAISDMEFLYKRLFERKLEIPITLFPHDLFKVILHINQKELERVLGKYESLIGQVSLVGLKRHLI
jgi:hypothetical protein